MKTWNVLVLLVLAFPARAQVDLLHESRLGKLYLSAAPNEHVDYDARVAIGGPFEFYLVIDVDFAGIGQEAQNVGNGIQAWEARISIPTAFFLTRIQLSPSTSLDFGLGTFDFVVGTGTMVPAGGPQVLVTFSAINTVVPQRWSAHLDPVERPTVPGEALWVESVPANGCSINGVPEACQFRFASLGGMNFIFVRAEDAQSFGAMKARF